jgi:hypothetical protein
MGEAPSNDRLVLTTETHRMLRQRVLLLLFFGGLTAAYTLALFFVRDRPIDDYGVFCIALLQSLVFGAAVLGILFPPRGTWVLNDEALTYHPCWRRGRTLSWRSVDRVIWSESAAILKGGGVKVCIPWQMFHNAEATAARAFVEAKLSAEFDLKDVVMPSGLPGCGPDRSRLERLVYLAKLAGMGMGLATPWLILVLIAVCFATARSWLWSAVALFGVITLFAPLACAWALDARNAKPVRRIHPQWPWRLARAKSLQLAKAANDPWLDTL